MCIVDGFAEGFNQTGVPSFDILPVAWRTEVFRVTLRYVGGASHSTNSASAYSLQAKARVVSVGLESHVQDLFTSPDVPSNLIVVNSIHVAFI